MVSTYGYATQANIEDLTGIDYSAVDATRLTDARVIAKITLAEQIVNSFLGETVDHTTTDGITVCTTFIAAKLLHNNLVNLGYTDLEQADLDYLKMSITEILNTFLFETEDGFVDSIPMTGASYRSPDSRMFL